MSLTRCQSCTMDYEPVVPGVEHNGIHQQEALTGHRTYPNSVKHTGDCPGCKKMMDQGTPYTMTPMSETYWAS